MDEMTRDETVEAPEKEPVGVVKAQREFKSTLLTRLLSVEEYRIHVLAIYNKLNGTSYTDPSLIQVNTIENTLYLGVHNDMSFILGSVVSVWEHQSTFNPNMPIRILQYLAPLYAKHLKLAMSNVYGGKIISLPTPRLAVFYNGTKETESDDFFLRLSDAFVDPDPDVEVKVRVLNINWGHNMELLEACPLLLEYAWFIGHVRALAPKLGLKDAIDRVIDRMPEECPTHVTLDFYVARRAEVINMLLADETLEKGLELSYMDGKRDGIGIGRQEGIGIGRQEGIGIGQAVALRSLVADGVITEAEAAQRMGTDVDTFRRLAAEAG